MSSDGVAGRVTRLLAAAAGAVCSTAARNGASGGVGIEACRLLPCAMGSVTSGQAASGAVAGRRSTCANAASIIAAYSFAEAASSVSAGTSNDVVAHQERSTKMRSVVTFDGSAVIDGDLSSGVVGDEGHKRIAVGDRRPSSGTTQYKVKSLVLFIGEIISCGQGDAPSCLTRGKVDRSGLAGEVGIRARRPNLSHVTDAYGSYTGLGQRHQRTAGVPQYGV